MSRLFSYVITHDSGFAPNPFNGACSLATCKPVIRKVAKVGDWLLGTGSVSGAGRSRAIYAARISEVLTIEQYGSDQRFERKRPAHGAAEPTSRFGDNIYWKDRHGSWRQRRNVHHFEHDMKRDLSGRNVLLSNHFWYFGEKAPFLPIELLGLVKSGPGHRCETSPDRLAQLQEWLSAFKRGINGAPLSSAKSS